MRSPDPIDVLDGIEPFTAANGQAFLAFRDFSAGTSSLPVRSLAFRNWFTLRFWNRYQAVPSPQALNTAIRYLESMAEYAGDGCQKIQVASHLSAIGVGRLPTSVYLAPVLQRCPSLILVHFRTTTASHYARKGLERIPRDGHGPIPSSRASVSLSHRKNQPCTSQRMRARTRDSCQSARPEL